MIDVPRTLHPASGVVSDVGVLPPGGHSPLWQTGVELHTDPHVAEEFPLSARAVGACGTMRSDTLLRGAGEAVERAALHPATVPVAVQGGAGELDTPVLDSCAPGTALANPDARDAELTWYPAQRLRDDTTVMVPAPLVDWPTCSTESHYFDPGPSGAAAGHGYAMALRSALLEVVERDAVMTAWACGLRLPSFGAPAEVATRVPPDQQREFRAVCQLWEKAQRAGLMPVLAAVPTAHPAVRCVVAGLDGTPAAGLASVGCKAADRPWSATLGAFQEAWQVRAALRGLATDGGPTTAPGAIVTEDDRVRHLASPSGADAVRDWLSGFVSTGVIPITDAAVENAQLVQAVLADGGDPVAVNLTPRLPWTLRSMGWCVVKVIPVGYQHLRMDERPRWSWNLPRLAGTSRRTGLEARRDAGAQATGWGAGQAIPPHPLP